MPKTQYLRLFLTGKSTDDLTPPPSPTPPPSSAVLPSSSLGRPEQEFQVEDVLNNLDLEANKFSWNKANAEDVKGTFNFISDKVDYEIKGSICQGDIESKGIITNLGARPIMEGDWKMKGVEIKEVMFSFENFDQTFITSDNIKGKTNVWAHVKIPYDEFRKIGS